jgi:hypothetical protein
VQPCEVRREEFNQFVVAPGRPEAVVEGRAAVAPAVEALAEDDGVRAAVDVEGALEHAGRPPFVVPVAAVVDVGADDLGL